MAATRATLSATLDSILGTVSARGVPSLQGVNGAFVSQLMAQDNADLAPTAAMRAAYGASCLDLTRVVAKWDAVLATALPSLNAALAKDGAAAVAVPPRAARVACGTQ